MIVKSNVKIGIRAQTIFFTRLFVQEKTFDIQKLDWKKKKEKRKTERDC